MGLKPLSISVSSLFGEILYCQLTASRPFRSLEVLSDDRSPNYKRVKFPPHPFIQWWNAKEEKYEKPLLNYTNPFAPPEEEGNGYYDEGMNRFCLYQFQRIAMVSKNWGSNCKTVILYF
jgi:hypothetical protein